MIQHRVIYGGLVKHENEKRTIEKKMRKINWSEDE